MERHRFQSDSFKDYSSQIVQTRVVTETSPFRITIRCWDRISWVHRWKLLGAQTELPIVGPVRLEPTTFYTGTLCPNHRVRAFPSRCLFCSYYLPFQRCCLYHFSVSDIFAFLGQLQSQRTSQLLSGQSLHYKYAIQNIHSNSNQIEFWVLIPKRW